MSVLPTKFGLRYGVDKLTAQEITSLQDDAGC